jgi:hypothetical protein
MLQAGRYRGINEFKGGYQLSNNLVKDENGDLLADSHNILNRQKNYISHLLNVHNVSDIRHIEVHTAEPLVPGTSHIEVEIPIAKLKKYISPGCDQIPAELIQAGGKILLSAIHKFINSVSNKEELPDQWKESIIVPVHKRVYRGISLLSSSYNILSDSLLSRLSPYMMKLFGDHQCRFRHNRSTTDQIFCICQILEKKWEHNETVQGSVVQYSHTVWGTHDTSQVD